MLVLSRKVNEEVHVGSDITITVLEVRGHVVRLGIKAPRDVRILRGELAEAIDHAAAVEDRELEVALAH
jgi:carbon storage regulator CsrA